MQKEIVSKQEVKHVNKPKHKTGLFLKPATLTIINTNRSELTKN